MELTWLEDFLALVEHRNFSRAAEARNVTQPAFSRRIRALEAWAGTPLVVRAPQGVGLNAAGAQMLERAAALVADLHQMRRAALRAAGREGATLTIAATHALSFTFFPGWIRGIAPVEALGTLNLVSDVMAACERILQAGEADFLLCHTAAAAPAGLPEAGFASRVVGTDQLVPVSAPNADGAPRWRIGSAPASCLLTYSAVSGLARILDAARRQGEGPPRGQVVFTAPLAATLQSMAREGQGLAWLPGTMVAEDLSTGRLLHAGAPGDAVPVQIRLFRPRRRLSAAAEGFWRAVPDINAPAGPPPAA